MANLIPTPSWDGVYQIETTDVVLGGPGGVANLPAQNLANQNLYARKHGGALPFLPGLPYDIGDRVKLASGGIVKSTIPANTNDPNVDMTGWISSTDASFVVDGDKNQKQINADVYSSLSDRYTKEETYNKTEVDASIAAIAGGHKAYQTLAAAQAAQASLPANTIVEVTNDGANNGTYQWNGTTLTKSAYDPLTQAKNLMVRKPDAFDNYSNLVNSNLPTYAFATVLNDADPTKNGHYQKIADGSWLFLRYNTPLQMQNYLSKKGFAKVIPLSESNINYNTTTSTLTFSGTMYAITNYLSYLVATPIDLVMPTSGIYRLEFDEVTRKLQVVSAGALKSDGWLVVGFIRRNFDGITTNLFSNFNINGAPVAPAAKTNYSLALTTASNLNFDFVNNKIVVSSNIWIQYNGSRIQIAPQTINLDPARNKGYIYTLVVNPNNSTLSVVSQIAPYSIPKDSFLIGAYDEQNILFWGLDGFSVNGKPFQKAESVRPSFGWDFNNKVDVNVSDSFTEADPLYIGNLTTSVVYSWFDQLVADFPNYVTKTTLGNDATGTLPIHQYRFKPKLPNPQNAGLNTKIPKVMLLTIHNEGMNMVALHILMREICRSWQNSESLESMRHGLEFVVIPVGNPWGLNNGKRTNSNQIDINRQFPANWVQLGVVGDYFYSGTAALSEAEAQHLYAAMVAEKPDVYFDVHSYGSWNNNGTSAWLPILNDKTNSAVISAMTRIYAQYKKKYSWIVDIDKLFDVSNEKLLGGGTSSKSAATTGAVGGTFESAWNLKNSPDGEPRGHTPAINFSTDLLATCILQSIGIVISSK